jgi:glycosyltransferase involved in cell wall biosynthesis
MHALPPLIIAVIFMIILTLCDYYLPGFKAGGPIRSISGMATLLNPEYKFMIVTRDHDCGDTLPYPGIQQAQWLNLNGNQVYYVASGLQGIRQLFHMLAAGKYDVLYLNSLFSFKFSILPLLWRRLGLLPRRPVVLAPRGECSRGALNLKRWRKRGFLNLAMFAHLFSRVTWQASSVREKVDINLALRGDNDVQMAPILVAPDLPIQSQLADESSYIEKQPGQLRIVFLSRIAPMKNLVQALQLLQNLSGEIEFDIVGPVDDALYWKRCQRLIAALPGNVHVRYLGPVQPSNVLATFRDYHIFLLPTLGENYGHVIFESLSAGCPVVISDRTPWSNLASKGIGWDLSLEHPMDFQAVLSELVAMDGNVHRALCVAAKAYAAEYIAAGGDFALNRQLFESVRNRSFLEARRAA